MRFLLILITLLAAQGSHAVAWAQGNCANRGGAARLGPGPAAETSSSALINLAYSPELAGRRTISSNYEAQQRYMQEQYLAYQQQLESDRDEAKQRAEAKERKIAAIKERRAAAEARREAAKAKRLKALETAATLQTAAK